MNIKEIMGLVIDFGDGFESGSVTDINIEGVAIREAIEQYGKEEREGMRKECIAACVARKANYNYCIDAIKAIK